MNIKTLKTRKGLIISGVLALVLAVVWWVMRKKPLSGQSADMGNYQTSNGQNSQTQQAQNQQETKVRSPQIYTEPKQKPGQVFDRKLILLESFKPYDAAILASTGLNVRKQPSTSAPVLRVLRNGEKVRLVALVTNGDAVGISPVWYQLQTGGYVHSLYVRPA